ncbi:MAG: HNH endonuclease [Ardenticatenaceae bacterium]|nr:HNH endonuclease [Ardenticatenaceae bacterium]MCB9443587.1 HNH endonuclease [Ardenticatenaceae bacterium]
MDKAKYIDNFLHQNGFSTRQSLVDEILKNNPNLRSNPKGLHGQINHWINDARNLPQDIGEEIKTIFGFIPWEEEAVQYYSKLDKDVAASRKLNREERQMRLKLAPKIPEVTLIIQRVYKRNPDVVAHVLERANGICEECGKPAPFIRSSDNTPYLEVHHKIPLSYGGEDIVENAMAVCPNCHRKLHYA